MSRTDFQKNEVNGFTVWQSNLFLEIGITHGFLGTDINANDQLTASTQLEQLFNTKSAAPDADRAKVDVFHLTQVHGSTLIDVSEKQELLPYPEADGSCLLKRDGDTIRKALVIRTADCVPVLLASPRKGFYAALHCGWRSSFSGLLRETVAYAASHGVSPLELYLAIGPAARSCCYEVGPEFESEIAEHDRESMNMEELFYPRESGHCFDLQRFLLLQAISLDLEASHISEIGQCTICNHEFFSYRRQKADAGRQLSYIVA